MNALLSQRASFLRRGYVLQYSGDIAQQLLLKDELPLLVLLRALVGLVVLPPDHLFALPARDVSHSVSAGSHVAIAWLRCLRVDHAVEEEGFAMLAAEVLPVNSDVSERLP